MTMALAVAMVACQAATPKPGEQGEQGEAGPTGPAGPAGTTDNDQPMLTKPLPMVYLAMTGTGAKTTTDGLDLSKHFSDTEKASLNYEFMSSDKAVASAELSGGKMVVKGKKAGMATITVMVYDGVTDPISETFEVMVVSYNAKPIVDLDLTSTAEDGTIPAALLTNLRQRLYVSSGGGIEAEISAVIHAGEAGTFEDAVMFSYDMGGSGSEDDIVSVDIAPKKGVANTWKIALTPLKPGMQNVFITVTDKFGATAETPSGTASGTPDADGEPNTVQRFSFVAFVNTVPSQDNALSDKTVVGTAETTYTTAEHFDTGETTPKAGPKIGSMTADFPAPAPTGTDETTSDTTCAATSSKPGVASVGAETSGVFTVTGVAVGTTDVTITCRDPEGFTTDTARITVRASR
jgi:hypothetical protein